MFKLTGTAMEDSFMHSQESDVPAIEEFFGLFVNC